MKNSSKPSFFDLLNKNDKEEYKQMRDEFALDSNRYRRGHRTEVFQNFLKEIHRFCIRNHDDDWKRCLVCGIVWLDNSILVNVGRLKRLMNKSKSNVNGVIAKLGYQIEKSKSLGFHQLVEQIPFLRGNYVEQRNWSIRTLPSRPSSPEPVIENITKEPTIVQHPAAPVVEKEEDILSFPGEEELEKQFNTDNLKLDATRECETSDLASENFNFFLEPICCAAINWFTDTLPYETSISFG